MHKNYRKFQCFGCGGEFITQTPEHEVVAEFEAVHGEKFEDCVDPVSLCDNCWAVFLRQRNKSH